MNRWLGVLLTCAWVLWMEIMNATGTSQWPKGAYPTQSYQVCLNEAKALADGFARSASEVTRESHGGQEIARTSGVRWAYFCLPDTIDPRRSTRED
jgi:hypothetical protein